MKENSGSGLSQLIVRFDRWSKETPVRDRLLLAVSTIYVGICLYYAGTIFETRGRYGILFLGLSITLIALNFLKGKPLYPVNKTWNRVVVVAFCAMAVAVAVYFYTQFMFLEGIRSGAKTTLDYVMAGIALFLVIETTRRQMGLLIPLVVVFLWLYAYFGQYFPGPLQHRGLSIPRIIAISGAEPDGIFGSLTAIAATVVAIFVFYTSFIRGCGAMDLLYRGAQFVVRKSSRLLFQVPVVSSLLFGMFSGSSIANAAAIGSFTIPLMKTYGVPPTFAAAVESVSSTAGPIMPPILGAVAFIMMDYLNLSYLTIMLAAFPGALIFYACVALGTDIKCRKYAQALGSGTTPTPQSKANAASPGTDRGGPLIPGQASNNTSIYKLIPILISMTMLILFLAYFQLDVLRAGFYSIVSFLASEFVLDIVMAKGGLAGIMMFVRGMANGIKDGASTMAPIAVLLACMSILMKVLVATALAQKLSFLMVDLSGGHLSLLLLMTGLISIFFGMVMAAVAAYILVAMLAAPALVSVGVPPLAAHFAVFYLSILAVLTPPVAPVCLVTSQIAKSSYLQTCLESIKLGAAIFILPFVFIFQPALVVNNISETPKAFLLTLAAMLSVTAGLTSSWTSFPGVLRGVVFLAMGALTLIYPNSLATIAALVLIVALITLELVQPFKTWLGGLVRSGMRNHSP